MGNGEDARLLAIGDSIIAGVGATRLPKALVGQTATALSRARNCRVSWRALGRSGYDSTRLLENVVPLLPACSFDYIIVSVGVNDITGLTSIRRWRRNLAALLDALEDHSPNALIAVAGIPPLHGFPLLPQPLRAAFGLRGKAFEAASEEVLDKYERSSLIALDFDPHPSRFAPDGYHPSEESYAEFGKHMAEGLLAMEAEHRGIPAKRYPRTTRPHSASPLQ